VTYDSSSSVTSHSSFSTSPRGASFFCFSTPASPGRLVPPSPVACLFSIVKMQFSFLLRSANTFSISSSLPSNTSCGLHRIRNPSLWIFITFCVTNYWHYNFYSHELIVHLPFSLSICYTVSSIFFISSACSLWVLYSCTNKDNNNNDYMSIYSLAITSDHWHETIIIQIQNCPTMFRLLANNYIIELNEIKRLYKKLRSS